MKKEGNTRGNSSTTGVSFFLCIATVNAGFIRRVYAINHPILVYYVFVP